MRGEPEPVQPPDEDVLQQKAVSRMIGYFYKVLAVLIYACPVAGSDSELSGLNES